MGAGCCSNVYSNEKVLIKSSNEITNKFESHQGINGESESIFQQKHKIKVEGNIRKEDISKFLNNHYNNIENKFKMMSTIEERKMEDDIRAMSDKNERINQERERKRIEREKKIQELKDQGLDSNDFHFSDESNDEKSRSRKETYNRLQEKLREKRMQKMKRSKTAFNDSKDNTSGQQEVIEVVDKFKFLRQSTHREASPKKGLLKRSKTMNKDAKRVQFNPQLQ